MKTMISLEVDMKDLDIDYEIEYWSEQSEYWGNKQSHDMVEIEVISVSYDGTELDMDYLDLDRIEDYIINVLED